MIFFKDKRGGMFDLILAMTLAFILVICLVIFTYAQNITEEKMLELAPVIQKSFSNQTNVTMIIEGTIGDVGRAYDSFKWISVLLVFGFFMSILVSSFLVRTHPVWFVGYIFIVIISIIISVYLSNSYETLMGDPILSATFLTGFWSVNYIFLLFPMWVTIIGLIAGILMYINLDVGGYYG